MDPLRIWNFKVLYDRENVVSGSVWMEGSDGGRRLQRDMMAHGSSRATRGSSRVARGGRWRHGELVRANLGQRTMIPTQHGGSRSGDSGRRWSLGATKMANRKWFSLIQTSLPPLMASYKAFKSEKEHPI